MSSPTIGVVEWFRPGEYERVEQVLADLKTIGVEQLRTGFSWADWYTPQGQEWYTWLLPRLAREVNILPCFHYLPPSLGIAKKTSSPPQNPKDYADFIDVMITRFGKYFEWIELWNEPNNLNDWDWRLDPEWRIFCDMVGSAAYWAQHRGKKTVLAGMSPVDPNLLSILCDRGVVTYIDAVGIHGFPGTWEFDWQDWPIKVTTVREVLERYGLEPEIWITETGFSTWRHDEHGQLREFLKAIAAPVERVYWYAAYDLHPDLPTQDGLHSDVRHYHMGLKRSEGTPKLLYRLWVTDGLDAVQDIAQMELQVEADAPSAATALLWQVESCEESSNLPYSSSSALQYENDHGEQPGLRPHLGSSAALTTFKPSNLQPSNRILITGGAGFIGTNLAHRLLTTGQSVLLFDNLSRPGVEQNLRWLQQRHGDLVQIQVADVRDRFALRKALKDAQQVFHFAAQVAVTASLTNPLHDFEINALGTLNLLEELRSLSSPPPLVFTSTNKVYGKLPDIQLVPNCTRYQPVGAIPCGNAKGVHESPLLGISEDHSLDFHSPYGCSKGAADQYVIDYARTFGIPAVVFRMSCIYGPHQFGTEDQGWVAHFLIRAIEGQPVTLYGDGMQVRDILFVEDLVDAFLLAQENIYTLSGQAFNIGGGKENTTSLLEFIELISEIHGEKPSVYFDKWRPGDQRYYVSDSSKFQAATGWTPSVSIRHGVRKLYQWLIESRPIVAAPQAVGKGIL